MSKKLLALAVGTVLSMALAAAPASASNYGAGCQPNNSDVALGTILGAIAGGAIGNQFGHGSGRTAATVAGVLIGGFAGNRIASSMSCQDQSYAQETYYDAYENGEPGQTYDWHNPDSGDYGYVTPAEYYQNDEGYDCREFTQTIYIDGHPQTAVGTACRNPDGSWHIVDTQQ